MSGGRQRRGGGENNVNVGGATSGGGGPAFFYEDEVARINKSGQIEFGMVTENWDMYSSDEEDEDEMDRMDKVPVGHVAVTWLPKSKDEVVAENKVQLSDRSLMPGDVIRRLVAGKDTQRGYCRTVKVMADVLRLGSNKVIAAVPAANLVPVQKIQPEVAVYMDSWVGVVRDAKYKVKLKFVEGTTCIVDSDTLIDNFEEIRNNVEFSPSELFFPGQHLRGRMKYLKDATFNYATEDLKRVKEKKLVNVMVVDVQPVSVSVQWQWQAPSLPSEEKKGITSFKPPAGTISGEDIKKIRCLNLFESCTVQISDVSFYTPAAKDLVMEKEEWNRYIQDTLEDRKKCGETSRNDAAGGWEGKEGEKPDHSEDNGNESQNKNEADADDANNKTAKKVLPKVCTRSLRKKKLKKAARKPVMPKIEPDSVTVVETLHTESYVDVVWQDGTYEEGMRSTDLYPIHHLDDFEFFPGDFVVLADSNDYKKYGVIQWMDHCGRIAMVKWFETYSFNGEQKPKLLEESEFSVYDLKDHPDFRFRPGTIVIRVANWIDQQCPAGQILDNYPDGQVRVWWADGAITFCWPQDLFRLGEYDSDEGEIWDDGLRPTLSEGEDGMDDDCSTNSDSSWETESEDGEKTEGDVPADRYRNIEQLIDRIQTALVNTREAIVASSNVTVAENEAATNGPATPVSKLGTFDERGLTKKLLLIYKDCQYLDKIMGTKHFDVEDLKKLRCASSSETASAKARRIVEQISRLFDVSEEEKESAEEVTTAVKEQLKLETPQEDKSDKHPGMVLHDMCSIILQKLVAAHSQYEERFGKCKQPIPVTVTVDGITNIELTLEETDISKSEPAKTGELLEGEKGDEKANLPSQAGDAIEPMAEGIQSPAGAGLSAMSTDDDASNFTMVEKVHDTHRYRLTSFLPQNQRQFVRAVQKETNLLLENLPSGILVKGFYDRLDLFSVMIEGPEKTPYEDGLFMFDIQLPPAYPSVPPLVHYISFCTDRLNPNLYEEGKVCVSLLGTWNGKGTEVWTSSSSLLQLLVSIQGLILGPEPYYNEAGYEKQKGSQQGAENSRMYNENVLIKLVQSMSRMLANPPSVWQMESQQFIKAHGNGMVNRYKLWLELDPEKSSEEELPAFPLLPVSKGFKITLNKTISSFSKLLASL